MRMWIDRRFKQRLKGRFEAYDFEIGILQDGEHYQALTGKRGLKGKDVIKNFAGGPARRHSRTRTGIKISDVARENRDRLGFNFFTEPFKKKSSDIIRFTKVFFDVVMGRTQTKRLENLLQAIVRNPILRGEYGPQSELTTKIKGFDRPMIDTSQLFKAIRARARKVR